MKKTIFLDRDGVINKNIDNLIKPEQFHLMIGVSEAIKKINKNGYLVIVITNQPIIAKGFCTLKEMNLIHKKMLKEISKKGGHIDSIYMCPHHPEKGFDKEVKELKIKCNCRKPKPGLILKAIKDYDIDIKNSWMVGDSKSDILAGQKAGVKTILLKVGGGSGSKMENKIDAKPNKIFFNLKEAIDYISVPKNKK